jgi:hypothetical protein
MDELIASYNLFQKNISKDGYRDIKHMNKQMKMFIRNFSDIISKYEKYDLDEIDKIINKQKELEEKNHQLEEKTRQLEIQLMENNNIIDKSVNIGKDFVNKMKCILSLQKTFQELLGTEGIVGGSLIRQLFELPVALSQSFETPGYGNPIGRDIDIYISSYKNLDLASRLQEKVKDMNNFIKFHRISPQTFPSIKIGDYELIEITDSTLTEILPDDMYGKKKLLNIPHYLFIFKDENNKQITMDVLGWKPESDKYWPNNDFNVNEIIMESHGFSCDDKIINVLHNIFNKEAICNINFKILHNVLTEIVPKSEKIPKLNQMIFFLVNRMKIKGLGYKICGSAIPDVFVEDTEICNISGINPPYLSLKLVCGHSISLMTFVGIVNEHNDYTEAIRCPYCRDSILINLIDVESSKIISWQPPNVPIEPINLTVQKSDEIQLFSAESTEYIKNILFKRESRDIQPVESNDIPTVGMNRTREILTNLSGIPRTRTRINSTNNSIAFTYSS